MNILDNELVRKYFGEGTAFNSEDHHKKIMAFRVISAMQQPIRKGERYISLDGIVEMVAEIDMTGSHFYCLRLPDAFQKQECEHAGLKRYCGKDVYCEECKKNINSILDNCHISIPHMGKCQPTPSPEKCECVFQNESVCPNPRCPVHTPKNAVEKKISHIKREFGLMLDRMTFRSQVQFVEELHDLVRLARESKPEMR